ncbi:MAG: hypothetical protein ABJZ55_01095 [Fuerstiella sp.]
MLTHSELQWQFSENKDSQPSLCCTPHCPQSDQVKICYPDDHSTVVLRTTGADLPGCTVRVNHAIRKQGGDIHTQCGHRIRSGHFEVVSVFSVSRDWSEQDEAALQGDLLGFQTATTVLARQHTSRPNGHNSFKTWSIDMIIYDAEGVLFDVTEEIRHHRGDIKFWLANPWQAPFCGIKYLRIRALVDLPSSGDIAALAGKLEAWAFEAGGDFFIEEGVHINGQ